MAKVIVTLKIMPGSPDSDLDAIEKQAKRFIAEFAGEGETRTQITPIAFGLKEIRILFVMDEKIGTTDPLEQKISDMDDVNSVEVVDVRRALG